METWLKDVEGIKTVMKFKNNIYMMTTYKTLHTKYKIILVLCTLYHIDMMCIIQYVLDYDTNAPRELCSCAL